MDGPECKVQGNRMLQLDKLFGNWQEINEKTLSKHLWTLWKMLRYSSLEETNALYEFYLMISAGFAWLGIILSATLGRLIKM